MVFASEQDAERAVNMFNGYEYNGRQLKVHHDKFSTQAPNSLMSSPNLSAASVAGGLFRSSSPLAAPTASSLLHSSFGLGELGRSLNSSSPRSSSLLGSMPGGVRGYLDRDTEDPGYWHSDRPSDREELTASSLAASMRLGLNMCVN